AICPLGLLSPLDFVAVINKRTEDKCDIAIDKLVSCHPQFLARIFEKGPPGPRMKTPDAFKKVTNSLYPTRSLPKAAQCRSISPNVRVFINKTAPTFDVGDHHAHITASG